MIDDDIYDFGDHWEHSIILEKVIDGMIKQADCIAGEGACPHLYIFLKSKATYQHTETLSRQSPPHSLFHYFPFKYLFVFRKIRRGMQTVVSHI